MEIKRLALVLVDISGYTRFMKVHTMSLLHAEAIITDLLEAVIDHAEYPLTLSKLEGDAAFLYAPLEDEHTAPVAAQAILKQVTAFFDAFRAKERDLIACDTCRCEACNNIAQLKLKAFLHVGPAVIKRIRQFEELGGEDVILIHRLLKNTIPAKEYILLTEAFYELSGGFAEQTPEARTEECEGVGPVPVRVYYSANEEVALPPRPAPGPPMPGTELGAMAKRWNDYAVGRIVGRLPSRNFSHLPQAKWTPLNLWSYFVGGIGHNILSTLRYQLGSKDE